MNNLLPLAAKSQRFSHAVMYESYVFFVRKSQLQQNLPEHEKSIAYSRAPTMCSVRNMSMITYHLCPLPTCGQYRNYRGTTASIEKSLNFRQKPKEFMANLEMFEKRLSENYGRPISFMLSW